MILVIAEQRDGKLNRATWETIAAAQQLAGGMPIKVAVLGGATGAVAQEVASAAVAEVLVAEHAALEPYTPDAYASASRSLIESASQIGSQQIRAPLGGGAIDDNDLGAELGDIGCDLFGIESALDRIARRRMCRLEI